GQRRIAESRARLDRAAGLLEAYSYQGVLARGYALVTDSSGTVVRSADAPKPGESVDLTFADGKRAAIIDGGTARRRPARRKDAAPTADTPQGSLF
ncbi:MAG: exodeoxyribonuclease VII large subunit, partial [Litorimonas sp.]